MLKKLFELVLFGSIFIGCCTVALCMQTNIVLGLPLNPPYFYVFVFGATLTQYNLHYVTKTSAIDGSRRLQWSLKNRKTHFLLLGIGVIMIIYSLFGFSLYHFGVLILLGGIAFFYSFPMLFLGKRIKDFGILKILTLVLLWTLVTVWFPANRMGYDPAEFAFIFFRRFVFMFVLCLLFDIKDGPVDRLQGIRTLGVMLSKKSAHLLCYALLTLFVLMSLGHYLFAPGDGFFLAMLLSAIATGYIVYATRNNNSDVLYLAGVDGMMLLQFLLVYVFSLNL